MTTATESLDSVRKTYRVKWYRCPVERETLRELTRRSDLRGAVQTGGHLALVLALGVLTYVFYFYDLWVGFGLALFAHGTVASHLIFGCHELGHGTVFKTRWLNGLFVRIYSLLAWWNFHEYAMSHTYHHVYTLHRRGDREVVLPQKPSLDPLFLLQIFTLSVTGGLESRGIVNMVGGMTRTALGQYAVFGGSGWLEALYANQPEARRRAVNWARIVIGVHLTVAVVSLAYGQWLIPVLFSLAPAIANWHRTFVGATQHCGLRDDVADFRKCVRTTTLNPISAFLYWHMNWHLEHHMFAAVPCYNLKAMHRAVAHDMPAPRTLIGAWREMLGTRRRQLTDPSYQFDTPLPATAQSGLEPDTSDSAEDAAAIGEIAPRELRAN